ncbi:MAG: ABC transporter substrate-binding protein [Deltaproteobacteria bacterium]
MKTVKFLGLPVVMALALLFTILPFNESIAQKAPATKTGTLKIGVSLPLSGPAAAWGNPISEVALIYADLLNKDGGVNIGGTTYKINLIVSDDKFTPDGMKASADRLINTEKVSAVVGGWLPSIASILGRECTAANIPIIQGVREMTGLEVVSPKYPVMFYLGPPHFQLVENVIPKLKEKVLPNIKYVALLSKDDAIGRSGFELIGKLRQQWKEKYGLEIAYESLFPITAQDMTPWLTKIAQLPKVDVIYAPSATSTNLAMISKQAYEKGLRCPIVLAATLTDVGEFVDTAGSDAAQFVYTHGCAPWDFPKASKKFMDMANRIRKAWNDKKGKDLTYGASFEFCTNQLLIYLEAAKIAGSVKTEDIVRTLETKPVEHFYGTAGLSGKKTYGINRMLLYDTTVAKVVGRENKVVMTFGEPIP